MATKTANGLVFDLAHKFRDIAGVPVSMIKDILDRARALQDQLLSAGELSPELRRSHAAALGETVNNVSGVMRWSRMALRVMYSVINLVTEAGYQG